MTFRPPFAGFLLLLTFSAPTTAADPSADAAPASAALTAAPDRAGLPGRGPGRLRQRLLDRWQRSRRAPTPVAAAPELVGPDGAASPVTDPASLACHPRTIGHTPNTHAFGLAMTGEMAVLATSAGMETWDLSQPLVPKRIGHFDYPDETWGGDCVVAGTVAFVSTADAIKLVDISDPSAPRQLSEVAVQSRGYLVDGNLLAVQVSGTPWRIRLFDVADPVHPAAGGEIPLTVAGAGFVFEASHLYLSNGEIWSVANPAAPVRVAAGLDLGGALLAANGLLFGSATSSGSPGPLRIWSLTNPAAPQLLFTSPMSVNGQTFSGGLLFVNEPASIGIWDVSVPSSPIRLGQFPTTNLWGEADSAGQLFAAVDGDGRLESWDISDRSAPRLVSANRPVGWSLRVGYSGSTLVEAVAERGIVVRDITDPRDPVEIGALPMPFHDSWIVGLQVEAPFAVLFDETTDSSGSVVGRASVIDLSNPASPRLRSRIEGLFSVYGPPGYYDAGYLYMDWSDGSFRILDLSDPDHPALRGSLPDIAFGWGGITVAGTIAAVPDRSTWNGVRLIDVRDPDHPVPLGATNQNAPRPLSLDGTRLLAGGGTDCPVTICSSVRDAVFDLSSPLCPSFGSWLPGPRYSSAMSGGATLRNDFAFRAYSSDPSWLYEGTFDALDLRSLSAPTEVGTLSTPFYPLGISLDPASRLAAVPMYTETRLVDVSACGAASPGCLTVATTTPSGSVGLCKPKLGPTPSIALHGLGESLGESACPGGLFAYQWLKDGQSILGATSATYQTPGSLAVGSYAYQVRAHCSATPACEATSRPVTVVVSQQAPTAVTSVRLTPAPEGRIVWADIPGQSSYEVRYDPKPDGSFANLLDSAASGARGIPWPPYGPADLYFEVRASGGCGTGP